MLLQKVMLLLFLCQNIELYQCLFKKLLFFMCAHTHMYAQALIFTYVWAFIYGGQKRTQDPTILEL